MWKLVKADATTKSTLYLLDAEDQLLTMKIIDNEDTKTHFTELKAHFQLMVQRQDNLVQMGSTLSETRFNTIIMSSLPKSYHPSLQTIMAAERVNKLSRGQSSGIKSINLIAFLIEEAQLWVINEQHGKNAELALAAYSKGTGKNKYEKKKKLDEECENCERKGHTTVDCFVKGGGKEGQAPWQNKGKQKETVTVAAVKDDEEEMFVFTVDSRASNNYSPDWTKFSNYREID